jgi:hypothetical protein
MRWSDVERLSRRRVVGVLAAAGSALVAGCAGDDAPTTSRTGTRASTGSAASTSTKTDTTDSTATERDEETTHEHYERLTLELDAVDRSTVADGVLTDPATWDVYERRIFEDAVADGRTTVDAVTMEPLRETAYVALDDRYVRVDRSVASEREVRAYDFSIDSASTCESGDTTTTTEPIPVGDLPPADGRTVLRGHREYYAEGACFASSGPVRDYDDAAADRSVLLDSPTTTVLVDGETYRVEYEGRRRATATTYAYESTTVASNDSEFASAVAPEVVWHVDPDEVDDALMSFFDRVREATVYQEEDPIPDVAQRFVDVVYERAYDVPERGVHYLAHDGTYFRFRHQFVQT